MLGTVNVWSGKKRLDLKKSEIADFREPCLLWMLYMDVLTGSIGNSVIVSLELYC